MSRRHQRLPDAEPEAEEATPPDEVAVCSIAVLAGDLEQRVAAIETYCTELSDAAPWASATDLRPEFDSVKRSVAELQRTVEELAREVDRRFAEAEDRRVASGFEPGSIVWDRITKAGPLIAVRETLIEVEAAAAGSARLHRVSAWLVCGTEGRYSVRPTTCLSATRLSSAGERRHVGLAVVMAALALVMAMAALLLRV